MNTITKPIPEEYVHDFGFSAMDAPPTPEEEAEEEKGPGFEEVLEALSHLSVQMGEMLSATRATNNISTLARTEAGYNKDIAALEKLIVPMLTQLITTADKDWIHWPNRKEQIEKQRAAILAITRKTQ